MVGETPDCNCASRGMLEGTRHGLNCPYGKRLAQEFIAEQQARQRTPPVEGMTRDEALAEAQAQAQHWRGRALAAEQPDRKATTMARRHRLSTHLIRRTARMAQRHYEGLQYEATLDGPAGEHARKMLVDLGVGLTQQIKVEPTTVERGKWRVVAE